MKKFYAILCLAIASLTQLQAQAPQGFNYQAQVRNSLGDLIVNANVYFRFNIMQGSQTSLPVFTEIHYAPTDDLGQISLVIGQGTAIEGTFSELDWSLGSYYLGIELDTGNGYLAMGTTQLLSVPYALYAENSGNAPPPTPNLEAVLAENNSANNQQIKDLQDPTDNQDAVTKAYVDNLGFSSESSSRYQMDSFSWHNTGEVIFGFNVIDTQTGIVKTYFRNWNWDNYSFYRVTNTHPEINNSSNGRFQVSSWSESILTSPFQKLFGFNVIDTETGTIKCFRNIYPGELFYECSTTNPVDSTYDFDGDGFSESQGDCDDTNDNINPNAVEVCDGIDNDCDGLIDEGVLIIFYQDSDSDGFGNPDIFIESCSLPNGYSYNNLDCDDQNPQVNPEVIEIQDGIDNDCDGIIDEVVLATLYTNTIFNVTISSAQSGGTVTDDGGGTVSSRGIVWSTSSTPTLENNEGQTTDGSGSGSFVSNLTALSPGTTYNVRAYATNEAGTAYGQVEIFETEIDFATLTTTAITAITVDSAQSGGTVTDDGGGTVSSRGIVWSTSSTPTLENNEGQTTDGSGSGSFVSNLTALSPGTTYNVRAYATNEAGTAYGQVEIFETEIDFATLTTTAITAITVDSAQSGGTVTDDGSGTVSSRGIVWSTSSTPTLENNEGQTTDGSGSGSFISNLTALSPGTTYNVRAYATNEAGTAYGQVEIFETITENDIDNDGIFFSQFIETPGNDGRAIEIYNGTSNSIDLTDYQISVCVNGCDTQNVFDYIDRVTFSEGSIILSGDVFVISNTQSSELILNASDLQSNSIQFTGNDTYALTTSSSTAENYTIIDIIGDLDTSANVYNVAGQDLSNKIIIRKSNICSPNPIPLDSFGTNETDSEWIVSDGNANWNYIGSHYTNCQDSNSSNIDDDGDGYTENDGDCDDTDATIYPGATDIEDGIDNDCDGEIDEIFDMDGDGYTENDGDCDDTDATIYPGATELEDGIDNDCDGEIDECFNESGMLTDQDGNTYNYLTYCDQAWSVENAEMVNYRDGTPIPQVIDATEWSNLTTGAWAYYNNDPTKPRLYNWYAVMGIHDEASLTDISARKKFAPEGWHVPTDTEWTTLENYLIANGYNYDGTTFGNNIAKAMASTTGWNSSTNTGAVGNDQNLNNSSGFNALPEGYSSNFGSFNYEGSRAYFWSSVQYNTYYAWSRNLINSSGSLIRYRRYKTFGFSVRFVRD